MAFKNNKYVNTKKTPVSIDTHQDVWQWNTNTKKFELIENAPIQDAIDEERPADWKEVAKATGLMPATDPEAVYGDATPFKDVNASSLFEASNAAMALTQDKRDDVAKQAEEQAKLDAEELAEFRKLKAEAEAKKKAEAENGKTG